MFRCPSASRFLAGGALLVTATGFLGACKQEPVIENRIEEPNGLIPEIPTELAMDRPALLAEVAAAASDYAAGLDDAQAQAALDGKRISFRIPFGCPSDASVLDKSLKLVVRPDGKAYEASASPDIGLSDVRAVLPLAASPSPTADAGNSVGNEAGTPVPAIEAAEGFWVPRPWMLSDKCPTPPAAPAAVDADAAETDRTADGKSPARADAIPLPPLSSPPRSVGLIQYYGGSDSRVGYRRGKPLTKIETITASKPPPTSGAIMVMEGRLRHFPGGKVILCTGDATLGPPSCLVSANVDRIAFLRADNGAMIAEWTR
nr:hypothetical protein [uncultured Sphingomonas sp.]